MLIIVSVDSAILWQYAFGKVHLALMVRGADFCGQKFHHESRRKIYKDVGIG